MLNGKAIETLGLLVKMGMGMEMAIEMERNFQVTQLEGEYICALIYIDVPSNVEVTLLMSV